ncbi:MAG: YebC/PmpR family DNA-binding transcriptional regulator [Verrucomicrobiales bacterium]|nr:YebC/PmpR family DNA-binding transcriptional regulator [Verrucomicrobiae bacterium]
MGRAFEYRRAAKEKRWDRMSKTFPKLARAITMAVKEGGPDPETNSKLRTAIQNAKAENMPKDNVDTAIKRAEGRDAQDFSEVVYEAKAPHGVLLMIECATDNVNRTIANLKTVINKGGGQIVQSGSLDFLFSRKAVIEFEVTEGMDLESIELELIDYGLEELQVEDGHVTAYAEFKDFGKICEGFEKVGITPTSSKLKRIPTSPQEYTDEQIDEVETLIDKLEDDEDVQAVYTNIA